MSVQYTRGSAAQQGMFSTLGRYNEYNGGYHEFTGGVQYTGGYHDYTGGYDTSGGRSLGKELDLYGNSSVLNTPTVLMISPHTHHGILSVY